MKEMPWMDIPPVAWWTEVTRRHARAIAREQRAHHISSFFRRATGSASGAGSRTSRSDVIVLLNQIIPSYHALAKQDENLLLSRAALLVQISQSGQMYLSGRFNDEYDLNFKPEDKRSLDYAIAKITRRAHRKAAYLRKLKQFLKEDNAISNAMGKNKNDFLTYLSTRAQVNDIVMIPHPGGGTLRMGIVSLRTGDVMEKLDPWHRAFEFERVYRNPGGSWNLGGTQTKSAFSCEFARWIKSPDEIPFLLWLEGRPIVTEYHRGWQYEGDEKVIVSGSVPYRGDDNQEIEELKLVYPSMTGILMCWEADSLDSDDPQGGVMDTSDAPLSLKIKLPGYAYVWDINGCIWMAKHAEFKMHHSSLGAGKKIQCAGMMNVTQGKVREINADSGHYQPTPRHLRLFVEYLRSAGVLSPDVAIGYFLGTNKVRRSLTEFLSDIH